MVIKAPPVVEPKAANDLAKMAEAIAEPEATTDLEAAQTTETQAIDDSKNINQFETEGEADLLTKIRGIGTATQAKLQAAGISTFKQLATTPPEEICEAIGTSRLAKVEEWIEQAAQLIHNN